MLLIYKKKKQKQNNKFTIYLIVNFTHFVIVVVFVE
jgi:hypothetical protein